MLVFVIEKVYILEFDIEILRCKYGDTFLEFHLVHFAETAQAHVHEEQFGEVVEYKVNRIVDGGGAHDEYEVGEYVDFALGPKPCTCNQYRGKPHLENSLG